MCFFFFFQAEDGIRDIGVTGVQTCALPIFVLPAPIRSATQPGVEAGHAGANDPAQPPDREAPALGGDEAEPHDGAASLAKKAAARLRISFSCSSRLFSRRSRASSEIGRAHV